MNIKFIAFCVFLSVSVISSDRIYKWNYSYRICGQHLDDFFNELIQICGKPNPKNAAITKMFNLTYIHKEKPYSPPCLRMCTPELAATFICGDPEKARIATSNFIIPMVIHDDSTTTQEAPHISPNA